MPVLSAADLAALFAPPVAVPCTIGGTAGFGVLNDGAQTVATADPEVEAVIEGTTLLVRRDVFGTPAADTAVTVDGRSWLVREAIVQDYGLTALLHLAEVTP